MSMPVQVLQYMLMLLANDVKFNFFWVIWYIQFSFCIVVFKTWLNVYDNYLNNILDFA